jgi:hypothetical protein
MHVYNYDCFGVCESNPCSCFVDWCLKHGIAIKSLHVFHTHIYMCAGALCTDSKSYVHGHIKFKGNYVAHATKNTMSCWHAKQGQGVESAEPKIMIVQ